MTKKDSIWLADHLRVARNRILATGGQTLQITCLICGMADDLSRQNPRFNRGKFLRACGVED